MVCQIDVALAGNGKIISVCDTQNGNPTLHQLEMKNVSTWKKVATNGNTLKVVPILKHIFVNLVRNKSKYAAS